MALEYIAKNGGAIIYMQQEGRGIGLANKVAAYALQDTGVDTVDANLHLGFPEDIRQYGVVPAILEDMKINSIKLLTNNPRKVERLLDLGVDVKETIPMVVPETNPHNHRYLEAKHNRMAHTNLSPLFVKNGNMAPKRTPSFAKTNGEAKVADDVVISMSPNGETIQEDAIATDDESQEGVLARDDGYCFGRQSVEDAIAAVKDGKMVVVVDDMNRENEGDLIMAADACTPEDMATIVRYSSGVICIAMEGARMDELKLPAMVTNSEDPKQTAFSVSVDATEENGKQYFSLLFVRIRGDIFVWQVRSHKFFSFVFPQASQLVLVPLTGRGPLIFWRIQTQRRSTLLALDTSFLFVLAKVAF
jgi:hypothetical protein